MTLFTWTQTLYVSSESTLSAEPYAIAFWSAQGKVGNTNSISLENTWGIEGIYLFLKASFTGVKAIAPSVLSDRIREFLIAPAVRNTRFLWIFNPLESVSRWRFHALSLSPANTVERLTFFNFRNYELAIDRGVTCHLNAAKNGVVFAPDPALHRPPGANKEISGKRDPVYFSTGYGANQLKRIEVNDQGNAIALQLTGSLAGCLAFALTLQNPSSKTKTASFDELTQMDVALRMFFKSANSALDPDDPFSGFTALNKTDSDFLISSHRYPFLGEDSDAASHYSKQADNSQNLTLYAALDPLQPLNGDRTYFAFVKPGDNQPSTLSFPSCYRTNLGHTIHVTPHGHADSRLIFAKRVSQSNSAFDAPLYLVPKGKYTLSVPNYDKTPVPNGADFPVRPEDNFLCGLAGIEYIQLSSDPKQPNILHLNPGQLAFALDFVPDKSVQTGEAEPRLDITATTAWAYVEHSNAKNFPLYFSQPKQSLLYEASNKLFGFLEVPLTGLAAGTFLPLFPYGGVTGTLTHYQQMEEQILNPKRRKKIRDQAKTDSTPLVRPSAPTPSPEAQEIQGIGGSPSVISAQDAPVAAGVQAMAVSADATAEVTGVTPQGLLATYSSNYETLKTLALAKDTKLKDLSLQGLTRGTPLRSAFQSSQMFLVVTDPKSIKNYFLEKNKLTIQGWTFDLNPSNWRQGKGDTDTVLIFKFLDKPLIEILKDTALWEQPDIFVSNQGKEVNTIRKRLAQFFEAAIATDEDQNASQKDRDNAAPLARIAKSPSWSGMVALNVALPKDQKLPKELKALKSGIKGDFYAQYVGSNGTPVLPQGGKLVAKQSSLFGLIDYQDTSVPETGPSGYAFQVSNLRIQFQNSQITAFSSELNLTLDKLFGEATRLLNSRSRRNIVILKGFTEEHNGVTTYAFSFSGENYFALPDSHILNTVDIVKAEFSSNDDSTGQFTLWGRFNFRNLEEIDLFSFGLDTPKDQTALNFNDFEEDPGKLALQALEVLERKGTLELANGEAQALKTAKAAAKTAVGEYKAKIASGDEIRDSSNIKKIQGEALSAFQELQTLDPSLAAIEDEAVQLAIRASKINTILKLLEKNDQFLPFSKLVITMTPAKLPNTAPTFKFDPSQLAFDLAKSKERSQSLYAKFPLKLVNFVHLIDPSVDPTQAGARPKGYLPVKTPLGSGAMPQSGFGLNFEVNLGSLGALAGAAQFVVNLLVIWQPNADGSQAKAKPFVGLRLPGIGGDVLGFPLQSVLKLSFKSVELIVDRSQPTNLAYLLKIKKVALKFFVLSFPPNGQTEIVIFGNPAAASNDAVGWYAAYAKEKTALPAGKSSGRASPAKKR